MGGGGLDGAGSSSASSSSRITVLLAERNSRRILPAVRNTEGSCSGPITTSATIRIRMISKMSNVGFRAAG
jgi:hypothetical protein